MCINRALSGIKINKTWLFNGIIPGILTCLVMVFIGVYGNRTIVEPEPIDNPIRSPIKSNENPTNDDVTTVNPSKEPIINNPIIVPPPKPTVLIILVPPFENLSSAKSMITYEVATGSDPNQPKRYFRVDRYSEAPRTFLEDILINMGGKVVERQRVDAILLESELGKYSGLVDAAQAKQVAKMLGANAILMGTISDINKEKKTFRGYGVKIENTQTNATIRIRLMDLVRGVIIYSKTLYGADVSSSSNYGGEFNSDSIMRAIADALKKLNTDFNLKKIVLQGTNS